MLFNYKYFLIGYLNMMKEFSTLNFAKYVVLKSTIENNGIIMSEQTVQVSYHFI